MKPRHLHLEREKGLTVEWEDGRKDFFAVEYLRRMSPSAEARELRDEMRRNPLTVLPDAGGDGKLTATGIEPVGNYAVRILFSDGHKTGLYSWGYLREIGKQESPS